MSIDPNRKPRNRNTVATDQGRNGIDPLVAQRQRLEHLHKRFLGTFGEHYDLDVLDANLAAVAVESLTGEPLWLLTVAAPSTAKTETLRALAECHRIVEVSTFTSDAGLLSGTPKDQSADDADGGILRQLEPRGILLIKDVTSILSLGPIERAKILAAFREVYDGYWYRQSGGEGGKRLEWRGRIALLGAVTESWDKHYAAISQMGDRFLLIRMGSREHRIANGLQALANSGREDDYRKELATLSNGLISELRPEYAPSLTDTVRLKLVEASSLTTWARTAVEFDRYKGDVIDANDPEGPARFAKQLSQLVIGAYLVGLNKKDCLRLAIRCARDSIPPLRLAILEDVAKNPNSTIAEVTRRLGKARSTVNRQLNALWALALVNCDNSDVSSYGQHLSRFAIADGVDVGVLALPERESVTSNVGKTVSTLPTVTSNRGKTLSTPERVR